MNKGSRRIGVFLGGVAVLSLALGAISTYMRTTSEPKLNGRLANIGVDESANPHILPGTRIGPPIAPAMRPDNPIDPPAEPPRLKVTEPLDGNDGFNPTALLNLPTTAAGSFITFILSAIGSIATLYFGWRQDRRHSYEMSLMASALGTNEAQQLQHTILQHKAQEPNYHGA